MGYFTGDLVRRKRSLTGIKGNLIILAEMNIVQKFGVEMVKTTGIIGLALMKNSSYASTS